MVILRSIDGRFYQIPDEEAGKFLVPADKVEATLRAAAPQGMPMGGPQQSPAAPPALGQVQAYHWHHGPHWWWGGYYNYYNYVNYRNYGW